MTLVTYFFSTKEALKFGKGVYGRGGERPFPSWVLVKASWGRGSHAGLYGEKRLRALSGQAGQLAGRV